MRYIEREHIDVLDKLTLSLYKAALYPPIEGLMCWTLKSLLCVVPFDTALGSLELAGGNGCRFAYNYPTGIFCCESLSGSDSSEDRRSSRCIGCVCYSPEDSALSLESIIEDLPNMPHVLRTLHAEAGTNDTVSIDFYRNSLHPIFSPTEQLLVQLALPHLFQAHRLQYAIKNTHRGHLTPLGMPETAICDKQGHIVSHTPRFLSVLQEEWPEIAGGGGFPVRCARKFSSASVARAVASASLGRSVRLAAITTSR